MDDNGHNRAPKVVCLGGGYVALYVARALKQAVRRGEVKLTVISRDNFHTYHGFVAEMLSGRIQPGQIISPARRIFAPARFHNAEIESVDLDRRVVTTSRRLDGRQFDVPYNHLVLGLGSHDDLDRYPGLAEHALTLGDHTQALKARNHLISIMEMAAIETDPEERARLLTVVVAGGNYGGVETVTELDDYLRGLTRREYPTIDADELRVVLVHSGERILGELENRQPRLQRWAERYVREHTGVELRPGRRVTAATPTEVVLSDGERLPSRTLISSTGTAQSPLLNELPYPRDERGRVVTDAYIRVKGEDDVWAGGDCAAVPHPRGGTNPPLAIFAMAAGWRIGRNILRTLRDEELRPNRFTELGDAVSLGRRRAVAHVRGVPFTGFPAWLLWRGFLLYFMPSLDRRLRLVLDWLLTPLVGRDVAQLQIGEPVGVRREVYEPDQDIVTEGDIGQRLYVIQRGEVDVLRCDGDGAPEVKLATLGPGEHFGELAVFEGSRRSATVRARTRVEVLSLGREAAHSLSEAAEPIGAHLRQSPAASDSPTEG